tara:strand:+ start:1450 stop:3111 length:1662 start_codon:yes stop_codon:yes gene_type:complete
MIEIFNRLKNNPRLFTQIIIASFFVNLLALATPIYVIQVLQRYVAYGVTSTLITLVAGIVFVSIFEFFFRNIRHRMAREIEPLNALLADRVMKKLVSIKTTFYAVNKQFRPDVVSGNLLAIQQNLVATTALILIDVPFVLIFLIALFLIHYQLGLIVSAFIFVPLIILTFYRKSINDLSRKSSDNAFATTRLHDNSISRYETVRYFNLVDAIKKSWAGLVNQIINSREAFEANKNILTSLMASSATFLTIIVIGWGSVLAVDGAVSVGALIGANILAARAISPIIRFIQTIEPLSKADTSLKEINQFLSLPQEHEGGTEIKNFTGNIEIKDLYFQYPQSKNPILEGLNCKINPGNLVAISGSNGSGKTTLIKTLAGILEFGRGQIFLDSVEMSQVSLLWLRKNLTYVPQEPKFVDGNLLENLIGLDKIERERMNLILKKVDLEEFVNSDPKGINMMLSNRGEDLPFGIRKRMAIARAMVANGQIVLLDEPTEALDQKGKDAIYRLIAEFIKLNKTVIISSLDKEILEKANYIIDIDSKPIPKIIENKIKFNYK